MTFKTCSILRSSGGGRLLLLIPLLLTAMAPSLLLGSDAYTFITIPGDGNISGAPGATIGWGYSITNESTSDWLLATNLNADSFAFGTPSLLFDFPEVAPGATVTEAFDPIGMIGLYEDVLNGSAPNGSVDSGDFDLSAQWYDGDPFNGGTFIADAVDTDAPYSATVTSSSSTPEPSSFLLLASGIAFILGWRKVRNRPAARVPGANTAKWMHDRWVALILTAALFTTSTVKAQQGSPPSDNSKDSGITRQQADEILSELKAIRKLLEKQNQPAGRGQLPPMPQIPQTGKLRLEGGYSLGSNDAPVTIVEFTDYQCPYCRTFESTTFAEIRKKYVDTGKVRFVVRDFPLAQMHSDAMQAAEAAHCAGDQGQFWPMHDALFSDSGKLDHKALVDNAEVLKLDLAVFRSCLESGKHKVEIQNDIQVASSLQINGTPAFLIGKTTGEEVSGAIVFGAQPFAAFAAKLGDAGIAP
jgi:protein-disulfide isomerase